MGKIKDRILLGIISGFTASIPCTASLFILNGLKLTDYYYNYPASIFLHRSKTNTSEGKIVSALVNTITNCTMGVINTYVLSATGRDKALIKGAGFGSLLWIVLNGFVYNNSLKIKSRKPYAPVYLWALHALYGGLCAYTSSKLGDDSLFPDSSPALKHKLPLVGNLIYPNDEKVTDQYQQKSH